jgi:hypothetical protein
MAEASLSINNPEKSMWHQNAEITEKKQALDLKTHIATQVKPFTGLSVCLSLRSLRQQLPLLG